MEQLAHDTDRIAISGRPLRYVLTLQLHEAGELDVPGLIARVEADGWRIDGRASKTVSDALRWEIARGRVVRVGRGRYRVRHLARSTRSFMIERLDRIRRTGSLWMSI